MTQVTTSEIVWHTSSHSEISIQSCLSWDSARPLEVEAVFASDIRWVFARDLFRQARHYGSAGDGDVYIEITGESLLLVLNSPSGTARLRASLPLVQDFLGRTYKALSWEGEQAYETFTSEGLREFLGGGA